MSWFSNWALSLRPRLPSALAYVADSCRRNISVRLGTTAKRWCRNISRPIRNRNTLHARADSDIISACCAPIPQLHDKVGDLSLTPFPRTLFHTRVIQTTIPHAVAAAVNSNSLKKSLTKAVRSKGFPGGWPSSDGSRVKDLCPQALYSQGHAG